MTLNHSFPHLSSAAPCPEGGKSLRLFLIGVLVVAAGAVHAVELGKLQVDSVVGRILDSRIVLDESEKDRASRHQFRQASEDQYKKMQLDYTELHRRILVEPVFSALPPYLAVSSIGAVNRSVFTVVIEVLTDTQSRFKPYQFVLDDMQEVQVVPPRPKTLSASEVLFLLLGMLASNHGLEKATAMAELRQLQSGGDTAAGYERLIIGLSDDAVSPAFIDGLSMLMTADEKKRFDEDLTQSKAVAVTSALFSLRGRLLLSRLLDQGIAGAIDSGGEAKPEAAQEQMRSLQNRLAELEAQIAEPRRMPVQQEVSDVSEGKAAGRWLLSRSFWLGTSLFCMLAFLALIFTRGYD